MNILAIDTTTKVASVAIKNEKKDITIQDEISNEITHSEKLLPLIDSTLKKASLSLNDINLYAAINGPGSFTGIRIGLATLKAFSMINDVKIFSMSSIELMSYKAYIMSELYKNKFKVNVASFIDARNNRVYFGVYKIYINSENKICIEKILNTSNEIITDAINIISTKVDLKDLLFVTNNKELLKPTLNRDNILDLYPTPNDLIHAYYNISNINDYIFDTYTLDAIYARKSQAERKKDDV